jgi:glycosyltransferase involved in cell wall biosynthesis
MTPPVLSVLMAVYNGEQHLQETIDSVLRQTHRDFELVIVDDGSSDRTAEILRRQRDRRIRIHHSPINLGVARATNLGLGLCRGEYVARTDADDLSAKERFERQLRVLGTSPEVGVCGTRIRVFGDGRSRVPRTPLASADIAAELVFANCIAHSSVMMRRELLVRHGLSYDETLRRSLDYDLWTRLATRTAIVVLADPLVRYRVHAQSLSATGAAAQRENRAAIAIRYLRALAPAVSVDVLDLHRDYMLRDFRRLAEPAAFRAWAEGLFGLSDDCSRLAPESLHKALSARVAEVFRWPSLRRVQAATPILERALRSRRRDLVGYGAAAALVPGPVWGYLRYG